MLGDCVKWIVWGFNFIATEWARKIGWNLYEIPNFIATEWARKIRWRDEIPNFIATEWARKNLFFCFWLLIRFA